MLAITVKIVCSTQAGDSGILDDFTSKFNLLSPFSLFTSQFFNKMTNILKESMLELDTPCDLTARKAALI